MGGQEPSCTAMARYISWLQYPMDRGTQPMICDVRTKEERLTDKNPTQQLQAVSVLANSTVEGVNVGDW